LLELVQELTGGLEIEWGVRGFIKICESEVWEGQVIQVGEDGRRRFEIPAIVRGSGMRRRG
jgi:hypothetical protein